MTDDNTPSLDEARRRTFQDALAGGTYRPPTAVTCLSGVLLVSSVVVIAGVISGVLNHPAWFVYLISTAVGSFFYARFLSRKQRETRVHKSPQTEA